MGHNKHMLWLHYDRGWLCSDTLFDTAKDSKDVGVCLYARYCLLSTYDAADDVYSLDLCGNLIINYYNT